MHEDDTTTPLGGARPPIENNRGEQITTLTDWRDLAPPTTAQHWREHRSAFELARAWSEGDAAEQLSALLITEFPGVTLERAIAERKTWFDDIPGGPRNHDLLVLASTNAGSIVIGVEAKADETFDLDLAAFCAAATRRKAGTRAPERLDRLTRALFDTALDEDRSLAPLRYQLLSALAGTLVEAKRSGATAAVLLVHEFVTPLTDAVKRRRNTADLGAFVRRLGDPARAHSSTDGWLTGPFAVPGNAHLPGDVPVYVGKVTTRVPSLTGDGEPTGEVVSPACGGQGPARAGVIARPRSEEHRMRTPDHAGRDGGIRRPTTIAIEAGATVIKLNVHPPGCRCGCGSKGGIPFMLNRPGDGLRPVRKYDLDEAIRQIRDWALEAIRNGGRTIPARASQFDVGGGMTTITLTVQPAEPTSRFVVELWDTREQHAPRDLDEALAETQRTAEQALRVP